MRTKNHVPVVGSWDWQSLKEEKTNSPKTIIQVSFALLEYTDTSI